MDIHIRDAQPDDAPHVARLIRELAATDGEHSPITEAFVPQYLRFPGSGILLAEVEDGQSAGRQIAGLLSYSVRPDLYHCADCGLIETLIVSETYRGAGVGGALVSAVMDRLGAMGCAEVSVTTMPDNEGAQRFYRSHGLVDEAVYLEMHFAKDR